MGLAVRGVERGELAIRRHAHVREGADVEKAVLAVGRVDDVDRLADAEEHLDGPRQREAGGDDGPGVDLALALGGAGEGLGPRLVVRGDGDEGVVGEQGDHAVVVEAAVADAEVLGGAAERELREVALQVVVAAHGAVVAHHQQPLVLGPPQALDRALVPADALQQLARAAVYVDAGLRRLGGLVGRDLGVVSTYCC